MIGSSLVLLGAAVVGFFTALTVFQRCPHCRKIVRRARSRRWLRCRHCGRQYNRTVRPLTS